MPQIAGLPFSASPREGYSELDFRLSSRGAILNSATQFLRSVALLFSMLTLWDRYAMQNQKAALRS